MTGTGSVSAYSVPATGPLTEKVLEYESILKEIAPGARAPSDWAPLAALVAVDQFERIGTFLEAQNWGQYTEMLTDWAQSMDSFETTPRRVTEQRNFVFFEIEERHRRGETVNVVNSMTVFEFDADSKIRHLDVYLQQPR
jgi:hypothetical protein